MQNDRKKSFKLTIGSQYFLYFGVMGIFLPYFNLYCYDIGLSGFEIGSLSAVRSIAMILCPLIWGAVADRYRIRKPLYILFNILSACIWSLFLYTIDFWAMLVITTFYGIFYSPIISFLEAFTMDALGDEKKSYGRIRVWGSLSFIIIVLLFGKIIDLYTIKIILAYILAGSLFHALISIRVPDIGIIKKESTLQGADFLKNRRVITFLVCAFLMLLSHGTYYGFFSIHLSNCGYKSSFIGIAWALASISEIFVMINSDRIFKRFSLENILLFSFLIAGIRWMILFFCVSPIAILLTQVLHAITYGAFHIASIIYIDSLSPEMNKTFGQAVNNAITYGLGLTAGFFLNGYLFEKIGPFFLFILSSMIAFMAFIVFWEFCRLSRKKMRT